MKRKIKRTIDFRYRLICYWCTTGEIQYISQFSNVHDEKIKDEEEWKESLAIWGDKMRPGLIEFLERAARQKCKKYGRAGTICWKYEVEEPGFQFAEEVVLVPVPEVEEIKVPIPVPIPEIKYTAIEIERAKADIQKFEDAAKRIPFAREYLLNRAKEIREKYNIKE